MAVRAPRPCTAPGCGQLSRDGSGRCQAHKRQGNWGRKAKTTERGYGAAWRRARRRILQRDRSLCQPCLEDMMFTTATQVDHITPKAQGGTDDEDNLQSICTACHRAKTAREGRG